MKLHAASSSAARQKLLGLEPTGVRAAHQLMVASAGPENALPGLGYVQRPEQPQEQAVWVLDQLEAELPACQAGSASFHSVETVADG